jgi:hypothetical protein
VGLEIPVVRGNRIRALQNREEIGQQIDQHGPVLETHECGAATRTKFWCVHVAREYVCARDCEQEHAKENQCTDC